MITPHKIQRLALEIHDAQPHRDAWLIAQWCADIIGGRTYVRRRYIRRVAYRAITQANQAQEKKEISND